MVNGALPDGWTLSTLDEVSTVILGQSPSSETYNTNGNGLPFYQGKTEFGDLYPTTAKWCSKPNKIAEAGDILISVRAPVGPTNLCQEKSAIGRGLAALRPKNGMPSKYLLYYLRLIESGWDRKATGTTFKAITGDVLRHQEISVAPLPEQKRIVAKIEELFTQLDAGTSALSKVRAGLRRYKASVLKAGMDGTLLGNGKNNDEFPEGWQNVQLADVLSESLTNGKSTPNAENGFPVLRLTALKDGRIDLRERKIGAWTKEQAKNYLVKRGDFFVSRGNGSLHLVGRGGLVEQEPDDVAYPDTLIRIRVSPTDCDINYLRTIWNSNFIRNQIETTARTTAGIYKINQKDLESFTFPLPPLEEQRRIVAEVERRLSVAREVESVVEKALARSARLRQAVLKSAFEGKLT